MTTQTNVPFSDLKWQWNKIKTKFLSDFHDIVDKGQFCLGPVVERFEKKFAEYISVNHVIGVNSGTSALHLSLIAAGIKPGDKVLIPNMTFIATAWAVIYINAIPVLCDIELESGNINIDAANIDSSVKAIIPVHLYGQAANLNKILNFAEKNNLIVIEDACQAHGAEYQHKKVGTYGKLGCFSFYPGKNLGAMGEAGAIVTQDEELAIRLRALRHHAQYDRYIHNEIGYNYRMDAIQALALTHKLEHMDEWTKERKSIAHQYIAGLKHLPIELPFPENDHVYHLFVIRTKQRDQLAQRLQSKNIMTGLHYPVPLHRQPALQQIIIQQQAFPISDEYANHGLSLPLFPGMTTKQINTVISEVNNFFDKF